MENQFILPSNIDKNVLQNLLRETRLVSKGSLFNLEEPECLIGYLDIKESDCFQFQNISECNSGISDMLAQKKIHKCSYAIRSATTELLNIETFAEAQDMVQTGIEDAVAVCCLNKTKHLSYTLYSTCKWTFCCD